MKTIAQNQRKELIIDRKISILLFYLILFISCNEYSQSTYSIKNNNLTRELELFIADCDSKGNQTNILFYYYLDGANGDISIVFRNAQPYDCKNIKGLAVVNRHNVFLYSNFEIGNMNNDIELLKPFNQCNEYVEKKVNDVNFEVFYTLKNNKLVRI